MNILAKNIKKYRKLNNISQKTLAEYLNVSQSSIAHYENGDRQPTLDSLMILSNVFKVSIDDLLGHRSMTNSNDDLDDIKEEMMDALMKKNEVIFNQLMNKLTQGEENINRLEGLLKDIMEEIGKRWEYGDISIADEHYMSCLCRNVVNNTLYYNKTDSKGIRGIALAGPNEQHTLGIELVSSMLKREGIDIIYLGQNVPFKSLKYMIDDVKPDFLLITVTMRDHINSLVDYIDRLIGIKESNMEILIGGQASRYLRDIHWQGVNIKIVDDINQVLDHID